MAINPPSDIVLDVMRAADPLRRQAAVERLAGAGGGADAATAASEPQFTSYVDRLSAEPNACAPRTSFEIHPAGSKPSAPFRAFEAFFLQSFIQSMLPKPSEATYGSGTAGDIWRSMSAEHIGNAVADAGGIGIAERLLQQASAGRGAQQGDGSPFSLASLGGAAAFKDWASYLPYIDTPYLKPVSMPDGK